MATPVVSIVQGKEPELAPDELEQEESPSQDPRTTAIEDFKEAFEQYQIPFELAENAYTASRGQPDPVIREAFVNTVLDVKAEGDEQVESSVGKPEIRVGVNDWKSSINITGNLYQKKPEGDISASEIQAAVEAAHTQWRSKHWQYQTAKEVMQNHPLLTKERDARRIVRSAEIRAWIVSKVPESLQQRLRLNTEKVYNRAMDRGYEKWVDRRADDLLRQRWKAAKDLVGVSPNTPPHLLPSRQYRAAVLLTKSDQELRQLRPLREEQLGAARTATAQQVPQEVVGQQPSQQVATQQVRTHNAPVIELTAHEKALAKIKEIQLATPSQYQTKAAEAMGKRLINQLIEKRPTVDLAAQYRAADQSQATDAHRQAVEANTDMISAVREAGVPVNIGQATVVSAEKKVEPGVNNERRFDRGQEWQAEQTQRQMTVS